MIFVLNVNGEKESFYVPSKKELKVDSSLEEKSEKNMFENRMKQIEESGIIFKYKTISRHYEYYTRQIDFCLAMKRMKANNIGFTPLYRHNGAWSVKKIVDIMTKAEKGK